MVFRLGASEAMRISSGNVGIGISTVNRKLEVAGNNNAGSKANFIRITDTDTSATAANPQGGIEFYTSDTGNENVTASIVNLYAGSGAGSELTFNTAPNGASGVQERLRIDYLGNVGIGTDTPSRKAQITEPSSGTNGQLRLAYDATNYADYGYYSIDVAASNPFIIKTGGLETMRLDSSQNLLVGKIATAFGTAGVESSASTGLWSTRSGNPPLSLNRLSSDGDIVQLYKDSALVGSIGNSGTNLIIGSSTAGKSGLYFGDDALFPMRSGALASAAVSLGSPGYKYKDLHLSGVAYAGSLLVNVTAAVAVGYIASIKCAPGTGGVIIQNSDTTGVPLSFRDTIGSGIGSVSTTNTATAYNTSSDQRLKDNIADADDAGSKIDAIQVRKFDWKVDGSHQDYGMVAQELLEVAPEAVHQPQDPEEMMGVDYSKLVPMMLKEIQSLRARIAALES